MGTGNSYAYDANGNMTTRIEGGITYTQSWTPDNRLEKVTWTVGISTYETKYVYTGDGVKLLEIAKTSPTVTRTTVFINNLAERVFLNGSHESMTKYYFFGVTNHPIIVDKKNWTQKKAKIRCKMETPWQKDDILQQNKKRQLCLKS